MRGAQRIAAWLTEKPFHAALGLAFTLMLPLAQVFTGALMTLLVLAEGPVRTLAIMIGSAMLVSVAALVTGAELLTLLVNAAVYWLPAAAVATVLLRTRSLPLTVQVLVIVALATVAVVPLSMADPVEFWRQQIDQLTATLSGAGLVDQADTLRNNRDLLAPVMTVLIVLTLGSMLVLVLSLGNAWYRLLPDAASYGRFGDLNLGRIIAIAVAAAGVLALITGAAWIDGIAYTGFAMFWLQGLALLHWLRGQGALPLAVLVIVYALLPVLNALLFMALAAVGFSDAWFDFRARYRQKAGA